MSPSLSLWFIRTIETFAPASWEAQRQIFYQALATLPQLPDAQPVDDLAVFVLAQIVVAQQLTTTSLSEKGREPRNAHATWYAKERQRLAKLLGQIAESPVVASFRFTLQYYAAEDVTCPHGRNVKTCEELYGLGLTLQMLERYPGHGIVRKQIERLRQREPWLPPLQELCVPQALAEETLVLQDATSAMMASASPPDERATYLLGTVVNRLRQASFTVAQSCSLVDQILTCCFGQPDVAGTRPARLVEQWRRLG